VFLSVIRFGLVGQIAAAGVNVRALTRRAPMTVNPQLVGGSTVQETIPAIRTLLRLSCQGANE